MSNKEYDLGQQAFHADIDKTITPEYVRQQHALWRAGYNAAAAAHSKSENDGLPTEIFKVKVSERKYEVTYADITAVTRHPRYRLLHSNAMRPVLRAVINAIEERTNQIHSHKDLTDMMRRAFEVLLADGFDLEDDKNPQFIPR